MSTAPDSVSYVSTLLRLSRTLNSSLDLNRVLHTAIEQVVEFVKAERGFILLVDQGTNRVWGRATHGIEPQALETALSGADRSPRPEVSRTIVEQVLRTREPVVSTDALEDPRFAEHASVQLANVRSVACVPLLVQETSLGLVYVDSRVRTSVFNQHDLEMLSAFANQAAVAIQNARLYENLRASLEEKLKLQDQLHRKETERLALEEANRLKTEYIGFVSHELKNPLTSIRGFVQTLLANPDLPRDTAEEFYETIEAEADRMLALINELLDSATLSAKGSLTLNARPVSLGPLLHRAARSQRYSSHWTANHSMVVDVPEDLPQIVCDEDKVHQIVLNLLSNAVKYSPQGGEVRLTARASSESIEIAVSDQGIGIPADQHDRIFECYERVQDDDTRSISGTGLGLYLTRQLVELHGGGITVESDPGGPTVFRVSLPFQASGPA